MSQPTLVIGNQKYSSWSLRPWLYLVHHAIPFTQKKVQLFAGTMEQELEPWFSDSKVPVLSDGDLLVWDSLAILETLAERYPETGGWPDKSEARALARAACAEMHSSFGHLRNDLPMNCARRFPGYMLSGEVRGEVQRIEAIWARCRAAASEPGPWLFGRFGVVDCMFAPVALRLLGYEVPLGEQASAYVETVFRSAAVQRWMREGQAESWIIEEDEAKAPSEPWELPAA